MAEHNEYGKKGEDAAEQYLVDQGYIILEKNWRKGQIEIDLIARKGPWVVFAEVKSRHTATHGSPESFVSVAKQRMMIDGADQYIQMKNLDLEARFDIISIVGKGEEMKVEHIEEAFHPQW